MSRLLERLQDPAKSGVYRASRADEIVDAVRGSKLDLAAIRLTGGETLLRDIARALGFPDWYGGNWDALEDCLSDLSWRAAPGHVLVFEGVPALGAEEAGLLADVLASAAEFWAGERKPFFAVLIDPRHALRQPDLFRGA